MIPANIYILNKEEKEGYLQFEQRRRGYYLKFGQIRRKGIFSFWIREEEVGNLHFEQRRKGEIFTF